MLPLEWVAKRANLIAGIERVDLLSGGHHMHMKEPSETAELVSNFVSRFDYV